MLKRLTFSTTIVFCFLLCFLQVDFSLAQNMTIETIPPEVDESGNTTEERIDQIVVTLRILAGAALVGTAGYWWHTKRKNLPINKIKTTEADQVKIKDTEVGFETNDTSEDVEENN